MQSGKILIKQKTPKWVKSARKEQLKIFVMIADEMNVIFFN